MLSTHKNGLIISQVSVNLEHFLFHFWTCRVWRYFNVTDGSYETISFGKQADQLPPEPISLVCIIPRGAAGRSTVTSVRSEESLRRDIFWNPPCFVLLRTRSRTWGVWRDYHWRGPPSGEGPWRRFACRSFSDQQQPGTPAETHIWRVCANTNSLSHVQYWKHTTQPACFHYPH